MTTASGLKMVANISEGWVGEVTGEDIKAYLAFWESLPHQERVIWVWRNILGLPSGLIGRFLDTNDVEETKVGVCGGPDCWAYSPRSKRAQEIVGNIGKKWPLWAQDSGVVEVPIKKWPHKEGGPLATEVAFRYIVGAVLSVGETDKDGYRQMRASLFLDVPRLKTLVLQWLVEHQTHLRPPVQQVPP